MVTLLLILGPLVAGVIGYSLGASTATRRAENDGLDKSEKVELRSYRKLESEITEAAAEAATLGDDSGVRILAILSKNRADRDNIK